VLKNLLIALFFSLAASAGQAQSRSAVVAPRGPGPCLSVGSKMAVDYLQNDERFAHDQRTKQLKWPREQELHLRAVVPGELGWTYTYEYRATPNLRYMIDVEFLGSVRSRNFSCDHTMGTVNRQIVKIVKHERL